MKPRIREAILVEGRYDKNTLSQAVDAVILESSGFGIFHDREKIDFLRRVAERRGLIIFTDSDGAGFVIRNRLKSILPRRRKQKPSKAGLLGVEGMPPEVILDSLRRCGAHFLEEESKTSTAPITRQDLFRLGLMGGANSGSLRIQVKKRLGLPAQLGTSGFLDALNLMTDLSGLEQILEEESE